MGEEYGETRPFLYFTSHTDPALARAVSEGRKREFIAEGADDVPDPQEPATFEHSKLTHRRDGRHGELREHIRRLLALRRKHLTAIASRFPDVEVDGTAFTLRREALVVRANLGAAPAGGLGPWAVEIEEAPRQRADPADPPHAFTSGDGEGLAP
jgi:maltooligosyltrehalose trehalohydrolase